MHLHDKESKHEDELEKERRERALLNATIRALEVEHGIPERRTIGNPHSQHS